LAADAGNREKKVPPVPSQPMKQDQRRPPTPPHLAKVDLYGAADVKALVAAGGQFRRIRATQFPAPFRSNTTLPPTIVFRILTSRIFAGSILKMSSPRITMSANLPGAIDPLSIS